MTAGPPSANWPQPWPGSSPQNGRAARASASPSTPAIPNRPTIISPSNSTASWSEAGLDSKVEYHFTESAGAVTRDNWLVELRGERNVIDAWGYYVGGTYEQDRLSGYQHSAFATAGALHQAFDSDRLAWDLRAGPGMRYRLPDDGDAETDWIFEMGSILNVALTDTTDFASETTMLAGPASRADQRFALTTAIAADWGMELAYRIKHEFEPQPGTQATDSHLNVSIVRDF